MLEDLHVTRAVHRLQREDAVIGFLVVWMRESIGRFHRKHVFLVPAPVTRGFPERGIKHLRRVNFLIGVGEATAHIGRQGLEHAPALAMPEHHARAFFLEVEQIHLAAELAVIALFRFRQYVQILVQFFLRCQAVP